MPAGFIAEAKKFYYDTAGAANRGALASLLELVSPSQILFGTDFPPGGDEPATWRRRSPSSGCFKRERPARDRARQRGAAAASIEPAIVAPDVTGTPRWTTANALDSRSRPQQYDSSIEPCRVQANGWELPERQGENVKRMSLKLVLVTALALATSGPLTGAVSTATSGSGPTFKHLGPLAFGPDGVLFAADSQDVSITALQLEQADGGRRAGHEGRAGDRSEDRGTPGHRRQEPPHHRHGRQPEDGQRVHLCDAGPRRGAAPVLLRVDGAGKIDLIALDQVRYSRIGLPNPPPAETPLVLGTQKIPVANYPDKVDPAGLMGVQTITHMAFVDGKLYVSGLASEEFASRMRVIPYPFTTADSGASVEIYHGSHGQLETFSPVFTFVPTRSTAYRPSSPAISARRWSSSRCRRWRLAARCRARRSPSSATATGRST